MFVLGFCFQANCLQRTSTEAEVLPEIHSVSSMLLSTRAKANRKATCKSVKTIFALARQIHHCQMRSVSSLVSSVLPQEMWVPVLGAINLSWRLCICPQHKVTCFLGRTERPVENFRSGQLRIPFLVQGIFKMIDFRKVGLNVMNHQVNFSCFAEFQDGDSKRIERQSLCRRHVLHDCRWKGAHAHLKLLKVFS